MDGRARDREQAPTPAQRHWRWVGASAVGEAVGLVAANSVNVLLVPTLGAPEGPGRLAVSGLMVVAGALEGACLGTAQWIVLRRWLPGVRAVDWIASTSVGFAAGWLMGAMSSALEPDTEPGLGVVIALAVLTGALLGAAVGLAQSVVLWKHGVAVGRWLGLTAAAWSLGMLVSYAGVSQLPVEWGLRSLAIGVVTGAGVGAVVGVVTGLPWRRLTPPRSAPR